MLRNITRTTLRHCAHQYYSTSTSSAAHTASRQRLGLVLGATIAAMSFTAWKFTSSSNRIALDSQLPASADHPSGRNKRGLEKAQLSPTAVSQTEPELQTRTESTSNTDSELPTASPTTSTDPAKEENKLSPEGEAEEGEEGAGGGGAYNPETGEINWDCPCLGGMAHGPCGSQFREAFSCFVFSEEDPKGINCVELFKNMQDCFREHPEIYADEIMDDEDDEAPASAPVSSTDSTESMTTSAEPQPTIPLADARPTSSSS